MVSDEELQRRLKILKEQFDAGKIKIASHLTGVLEALEKVRTNPDGTVDLKTVDGRVRSMALAISFLHDREETKKVPLREVQQAYFQMLEGLFQVPLAVARKHGLTAHQVAVDVASHANIVDGFSKDIEGFKETIFEFWRAASPIVYAHVEDMRSLKAIYGGDIFPSYTRNIASSAGLYMDTIVLHCPMVKVCQFITTTMPPDKALYYAVKHALNALYYKDLALAEVDPPIVVIAPELSALEEDEMSFVMKRGEEDFLYHAGKLFGQRFSDTEALQSFAEKLSSLDDVVKAIADPSKLLFDTEWTGTPAELILRSMQEMEKSFGKNPYLEHPTGMVLNLLRGRFISANDTSFASQRYRGTPLMDVETSWQFLLWKYQYEAERGAKKDKPPSELLVTHALHADSSPTLKLVSNIPIDALIQLRKEGVMADLREIIHKGIESIDTSSTEAAKEVADTVAKNLDEAFTKHQEQLADWVSKGKKFVGHDVAPWIGEKAVSFVAGLIPVVGWLASEVAAETIESPSAKELFKKGKETFQEKKKLARSPAGILYKHIRKK